MHNLAINKKMGIEYLLLMFLCMSLYFMSIENYLFFHTLIECITILLGFTVTLIALGTIKISKNSYFHYWAIIFGFLGVIELFHALTFKGINILSNDSNMPTQLWILGRYYDCIMLSLSSIFVNKNFNFHKVFAINSIVVMLLISSITIFKVFPDCYIGGYGLTTFKIWSEYIVCIGFVVILIRILKSKREVIQENKTDLVISMFFKVLSSLAFTLYFDVYGIFNLFGHLFKGISYYYSFKVIFRCIVVNPYSILFESLNNKVKELENANNELVKVNHKVKSIEELHGKFIDFIPDGILIIRDKRITFANDKFLKMLKIDDENKLTNISIFDIVDKSYHKILNSRLDNINKTVLEVPQQYEFKWKKRKQWFEVASLIANDEGGEYIITTLRSIEDRKKAEEAEQLLELKKKEENMKNDFFTNISHELRTPINVIYSALQVEDDYIKNDNLSKDFIIKYNKIIRQNCLRLTRLINNIIDTTRIESDYFKPKFKVENIVALTEDVTMSIVEYVRSKNIDIVFDTEIEEAYIRCDPDLFERILLNILSNAVKYGKDNGRIEVNIIQSNSTNISILIKDNGIGIPNEMKQRIFDRFLKVDSSLARKTEGSGIGLAIVKQLIEINHGNITFDSQLNCGSEFKITFPTVEYFSEVCITAENNINYEKNIITTAEIEFSDIY